MNEAIIQGLTGISDSVALLPSLLGDSLPTAGWDLQSLFENAGEYAKNAGGALLVMMGIVGVVWGGVLLIKKLMSSQQDNTSWGKIILLIMLGGALAVGGFNLIFMVGKGGKTTIEDLGKGLIFLDSYSIAYLGKPLGLSDLGISLAA